MYDLDPKKLVKLMCEKEGNMKAFCLKNGLKYTTIRSNCESSQKLNNMTIDNLFSIASGLGLTAEELMTDLGYKRPKK